MSIFDEAEGCDHDLVETLNGLYFVSFFHPFRFENNWVFKAPHIFRDVKISQNFTTLLYISLEGLLVLKTKFY